MWVKLENTDTQRGEVWTLFMNFSPGRSGKVSHCPDSQCSLRWGLEKGCFPTRTFGCTSARRMQRNEACSRKSRARWPIIHVIRNWTYSDHPEWACRKEICCNLELCFCRYQKWLRKYCTPYILGCWLPGIRWSSQGAGIRFSGVVGIGWYIILMVGRCFPVPCT